MDIAEVTNVAIFSAEVSKDYSDIEFHAWQCPGWEDDFNAKAKSLYGSGQYDNLIDFLIPYMPDFIQEEYRVSEKGK